MSRAKQRQPDRLEVTDLTPRLRRREIEGRMPKWKSSSQSLLCSLIEHTGKEATYWISGYKYARARNGRHDCNPMWQVKLLLAEQWMKLAINEEDLTKVEVHFMSFCRQLKSMASGPPRQEDLREEAIENQELVNRLEGILFRALSDSVIDEEEGPDVIEVLEEAEADIRDLRLQLQHAYHSNALPGVTA